MRPGAILQAAMDILGEIGRDRRPADRILKDWGRANRYAGSGDRARIGELVFAVLRDRARLAWRMDCDTPRALVLAHQAEAGEGGVTALADVCTGTAHAPAPLSAGEQARLARPPGTPPPAIAANVPDWLLPRFEPRIADPSALRRLTERAPLDLRVNTLKATRDHAHTALATDLAARFGDRAPALLETPLAPHGLRLAPPAPDLRTASAYGAGLVEVQDEGSQLVAYLAGARAGDRVIDLCAGAGGKTLALAAAMDNRGTILACDTHAPRLREARERLSRAGVTIAETRLLSGEAPEMAPTALAPADLVLLDVPCSGTGTWRRAPDARLRLHADDLAGLTALQSRLLEQGAALVRPGGRLVYITCSLLAEENTGRIMPFLADQPGFRLLDAAKLWDDAPLPPAPAAAAGHAGTLLLAPSLSGTDGFFLAVLERLRG